MYSSFTLFKKYIQYLLKAENGKGHGIHSPFVYAFVRKVLNNNATIPIAESIEQRRKALENNHQKIQVWDRGAGSRLSSRATRSISSIAHSALKPKKYSQLLYKIVAYYQPAEIIELGTSLGITTCYLAAGNANAQVVSLEGAPNVAAIARTTFKTVGLDHITLIEGDFADTLPAYLQKINKLGFAYIDGNHQYKPTMQYFKLLLEKSEEHSLLIFDDIHWSAAMEKAWEEIKLDPAVSLTIDLFFIGLVFVRKAQKEKEHFIIRY